MSVHLGALVTHNAKLYLSSSSSQAPQHVVGIVVSYAKLSGNAPPNCIVWWCGTSRPLPADVRAWGYTQSNLKIIRQGPRDSCLDAAGASEED